MKPGNGGMPASESIAMRDHHRGERARAGTGPCRLSRRSRAASSSSRGSAAKASTFMSAVGEHVERDRLEAARHRRPGRRRRGSRRARSTNRRSCGGSSAGASPPGCPRRSRPAAGARAASTIGRRQRRGAEQAHRGQQHAGLDDGRHVRGHRNAGAFVGVRRPRVEGHDRGLEEEGDDDQHDAGARPSGRPSASARGERRESPASRSPPYSSEAPISSVARARCRPAPGT